MNASHRTRGLGRFFAAAATLVLAGSALAQEAPRTLLLGDMSYDEKLEFLGDYSAEELFGIGTADYDRAAQRERMMHPCAIEQNLALGAVTTNTWPDGMVPYAFNANVSPTNQQRAIAAMNEISAVAPLTFFPRTTEGAWIVFNDSTVNSSPVGIQGGGQTINMVSWSFRFIIVHEILHSLGFWHEQQRPDRNSFVQINFGNIQSGTEFNFSIPGSAQNSGAYDFDSLMHYGQCDFSVCGTCNSSCTTITVLPPNQGFQNSIGQRSRLSLGDIEALNAQYGGGLTPLPIMDDFETASIDASTWFTFNGASITTNGINEPSGARSVEIGGDQSLRTLFIDATQVQEIVLDYAKQRTGNANSPEPGEDLIVEYLDPEGEWLELARHLGSGPDETVYTQESVELPADAQHDSLQVRFRNTSLNEGLDDFFIDDVSLTAEPALPGQFEMVSPVDGATGISTAPVLIWEAAPAVSSYDLLVDDNSDFSSPEISVNVENAFFSNPGFQLEQGTFYFWTVNAVNPNGSTGASTGVFSFRTQGGLCRGDCNNNGVVDFSDLVAMLFQFGNDPGNGCDANQSGSVDFSDLVAALFQFGPCE